MHATRSRALLALAATLLLGCSDDSPSQRDSATAADGPAGRRDTGAASADAAGDAAAGDSAAGDGALVGQGYAVGEISKNWTLTDQNGKPVNLYDYRGKVIYFESGSEW